MSSFLEAPTEVARPHPGTVSTLASFALIGIAHPPPDDVDQHARSDIRHSWAGEIIGGVHQVRAKTEGRRLHAQRRDWEVGFISFERSS
jgi:hypothetical protein